MEIGVGLRYHCLPSPAASLFSPAAGTAGRVSTQSTKSGRQSDQIREDVTMSRKKNSNALLTKEKQVKFGEKVLKGNEPAALVGPSKNKDTLTLNEFAEQLYGPGVQCVIVPPKNA
jgi:hypothetical protein